MTYVLSNIVEELLVEIGEGQAGNRFARFYQYGLSFLRQKHFTTTGAPKVVSLDISSVDTANLPIDYVQYTRIGLCINGEIVSLGLNNNICLDKTYDNCGNEIKSTNSSLSCFGGFGYDRFSDHYRNGENMGRFFGAGSDNNSLGYYRIDKASGQIKFSQLSQKGNVVLEYLADVNSLDGDFEVHPFMVEALKDWMFWKYKQRSSKTLGEQQLARDDYKKSYYLMQAMFSSGTKDEWIAVFQSGNQASPKM